MSITDEMRKTFDDCTVMAGLSPDIDFECVYITKSAALKMLDKIDEAFEAGHERAVEYGKQLGRGECEPVITDCYDGLLPPFTVHCSACGDEWGFTPNYCPSCGRKVKR